MKRINGEVVDFYSCDSPKNIKIETYSSWYKKEEEEIHLFKPDKLNENNDCSWFKDKGRIKEFINEK
jgi:uncharacterized protein YodC (DUF2158 family)